MENGKWNGKVLIASEIGKEYGLEKEIRKASGRKELQCPDSGCESPVIRYCHGEKRSPFFAHLNNKSCDYAMFEKSNSNVMKSIRLRLYEHFKELGYQVRPEVKVLPHHYAHLYFEMGDGSKIALELGTQQLSANYVDNLNREYKAANVDVKWIVVDNTEKNVREGHTYFLKRFGLNETGNKCLLVVSWDGERISQYKAYNYNYAYEGSPIESDKNSDMYKEEVSLNRLDFSGGELCIKGFEERYQDWLHDKWEALNNKAEQMEEEIRPEQEAEYNFRYNIKDMKSHVESQSETTYQEQKNEIIPMMGQQVVQVRDSTGKRWIKCQVCGAVDTEDKFSTYGGKDHINLGICYECEGKRN